MVFDVDQVLEKLTLEQKCFLLSGDNDWHTHAIPELGIPSIRMSDGPNGIRGTLCFDSVPSACLPCGTALGATWNTGLLREAGDLLALEARKKGVHVILGPTVNIQRTPIGGRGFESFSEDPVLSGYCAASVINGVQAGGIQATLKHFVCNDQEDERYTVNCVVSHRALREIYLLPFQLAVKESNPAAIMTAYNKVNGIHASQSKFLLKTILREEWNWDGLLISDWGGTYTTNESIANGLDLEMPGPGTWRRALLLRSVHAKETSPFDVEDRVRQVLKFIAKTMEESGIPENAFEVKNDTPETSKLLRSLASESIVLLKNDNGLLPLSKERSIAVIGPNAKVAVYCGGGSAALRPYYAVTPFDAIAGKISKEPLYSLGLSTFKELPLIGTYLINDKGKPGFTLRTYDAPVSVSGRKLLDTRYLTDSNIFMPDYHPVPDEMPFYIDFKGYLTPEEDGIYQFGLCVGGTGILYVDGKIIVDNMTKQKAGTSLLGSGTVEEVGEIELKAGNQYTITVEFGSMITSTVDLGAYGGGFRVGCARKMGVVQQLKEAVATAKQVDQVVLVVGLNSDWEREGMDRSDMDSLPHINELITSVAAANPNTVVVNQSGTPVTMDWEDSVSAIVQAGYGGNETGNGIADVLFGDVNPSGRLPLTFPRRLADNPAFLNTKSDCGRILYGEEIYVGYRYYEALKRDVLFPFGFGLSYTTFELSDLSVKVDEDRLLVDVIVKNTGSLTGKEVVQVYVAHESPKVSRPPKELKGFAKVSLEPKECRKVRVGIPIKLATSYWNEFRSCWASEKGSYWALVGTSSVDIKLKEKFSTTRNVYWKGV